MKQTILMIILIMIFPMLSGNAIALNDTGDLYPFSEPEQGKRFYKMINEVRCIVCQNQSLADSSASIAADLRQKIYTQILANHTDQEINDYLVERYGDFILLRPPLKGSTLLLWLAPLAVLILILFNFWKFFLKNSKP